MTTFETILIWGSVYLYSLVALLLLTGFIFNKDKIVSCAGYVLVPAFIAHTMEFALRWARTGYFPALGDYENAVTGGWFAIAFTLYFFFNKKPIKGIAVVTVPFVLLFLGYGIMKNPVQLPLAISLKSSWLVVHVLFAQIAFGAAAIASGIGAIYLLKDNRKKKGIESPFFNRFPPLPVLEEIMFKFAIYGFISMAIEIAAGSIWAKELWGAYWGWDPVEVWNLTSWLIYGIAIHLKLTLNWEGRRLAWLYIAAMLAIIITFWGVDLVVEKSHSFFRMEGEPELRQMMGK
ncbi:MAG: cytochrome c biogenesis protein CcsA [bacterium]|nr:cytochrome c biogenesis protein CcsA [bacterium]